MEIAVVSFSNRSVVDALNTQLVALDHTPRIVACEEWLVAPAKIFQPIVLVFDSESFPRARVIAALDQMQRSVSSNVQLTPKLGVFVHPASLADHDILQSLNDFVDWPCARHELQLRLNRIIPRPAQPAERQSLSSTECARLNLIGSSPKFMAVLGMIERIARCDAPVVIEGETGTGKEAAARAVHYASARRSFPFVPINCGAIPDSLVESELFGHERGAFTDAKEMRQGVIAQAEGGTLFLDEVDALSPKAQVALLRFLQDRQYRPLGGNRVRTADVRIVAATNANLQDLAGQGRFRADLMFRLNILSLQLPALRERTGDIALLARYFVTQLSARYRQQNASMDEALLAWLETEPWPGNVRELESYVHRKLLMTEPGAPMKLEKPLDKVAVEPYDPGARSTLRAGKQLLIGEFERSILSKALTEQGGNVTRAAKQVGKERRAFGKLLKKHNIIVDSFRRSAFE